MKNLIMIIIGERAKRARHSQLRIADIYLYIIGRGKRAPHWGVQSRFRVIYIYMLSVCRMSVVCQINCVGGITCGPRACSKSFFGG